MKAEQKPFSLPTTAFPYGKCKLCGEGLLDTGDCYFCEQSRKDLIELKAKHIRAIGGSRAWDTYTNDAFQLTPKNQEALAFMKQFNPRNHNAYIYGPSGTGKSHLAAIAKRPYILKGVYVETWGMDEVCDDYRANIIKTTKKDMINRLIRVPILSLEDVGVEKDTETTTNVIYQLINGRYLDQRNGLIITSNISADDLAMRHMNERVASRLYQMCKVFDMTGEVDWRKRNL